MLADVLLAVGSTPGLAGFSVITADSNAKILAQHYGAQLIPTSTDNGHSAAVYEAVKVLLKTGVNRIVALPGDTPFVTADEISQVVSSVNTPDSVTIVSDREGTGSNCIASKAPLPIPLAFGTNSFAQHCAFIQGAGLQVNNLSLPGLQLDIDTREDLLALSAMPTRTKTQALLEDDEYAQALQQNKRKPSRPFSPDLLGHLVQ